MVSNLYNKKSLLSPDRYLGILTICSSLAFGMAGSSAFATEATLQTTQEQSAPHITQDAYETHQIASADVAFFHASLDYQSVWSNPERLSQLIAAVSGLRADGLDPEHYALSTARQIHARLDNGQALSAPDELLLTRAYLTALLHLGQGVLDPGAVEPHWRRQPASTLDRNAFLMQAQQGLADISAAFDKARPSVLHYPALRKAYVDLQNTLEQAQAPVIPAGPSIREGMRDPRVPLLRERLRFEGFHLVEPDDSLRHDPELVAAVMAYQRAKRLTPDGIVGRATLAALNLSPAAQLDTLRINLERMRWLANEHRSHYVLSNIAAADIRYIRNGEAIWHARSQVGRPARRTPLLVSDITHLTLNPTWTVPPTILRQDKLPEIRADIDYLARNNMQVLDASGQTLDPRSIDWEHPGNIMLRQDAGDGNALGRVAIRFPNPFQVYLHDTPSQRLFGRDQRAFSSGCVRVEHAFELVKLLVEDGSNTPFDTVMERLDSGRTSQFSLDRRIPVVLSYWTAEAGEDGAVAFFPDVYGHDPAILAALQTAGAAIPGN